jgi:hypothetical protein
LINDFSQLSLIYHNLEFQRDRTRAIGGNRNIDRHVTTAVTANDHVQVFIRGAQTRLA